MSEKLISDLKESIASSKYKPLIICGAGVSVSATEADAPSWAELLESGIAKVVGLNSDDGDWATYARSRLQKDKASEWIKVADEITERLGGQGNAEFMEWIEEQVGRLQIKSNALLNAIKGLGCPVATTNYDDILAVGLNMPPITWDEPEQVHRFLRGTLNGVLHLHGHWRKPRTVVLGSASYDMLNADRKKKTLSEFAALQGPAIYVGCSADGLSDPDFTHLAAFVTEWQQTMPRSYWLVKSDKPGQTKNLLSADNPRLFQVAFGTKHQDLPAFLLGLAAEGVKTHAIAPQFNSIEQQEPRPEIFGRDRELQDLEDALINGRSAAIGGGPGFGKTALAVATLYRPKIVEKFRDRRVFVSLEAEQEPTAMLAGLAAALGLPQGGDEASILRQIQLVAADAPFIAILDNAEHVIEANRGEAERILRLTAQIKGFSVLITTRGMVPQLPDAMIIQDLAKLDKEAAKEAFLGIAGHQFDQDADLASLLETLDGHALSIEIVAARAAASSNLAGINEAWQEMKAAILRRVGEEENRLTSVRASLALSLEAKLLVQNPFAKRLLSVLATLPAGLPRDAAPRILAERGGFSKEKAVDAILVLQQLKLVERRFDDRLRMLTPCGNPPGWI